MLRGVIEVGDEVRIGESGASIFVVREVDPGEGRAERIAAAATPLEAEEASSISDDRCAAARPLGVISM
jgi:hypothetical protein